MDERKELLLKVAARLYSLGMDLEVARQQVKELSDRKTPYDSEELQAAVHSFMELQEKWSTLEAQYLELRKELS